MSENIQSQENDYMSTVLNYIQDMRKSTLAAVVGVAGLVCGFGLRGCSESGNSARLTVIEQNISNSSGLVKRLEEDFEKYASKLDGVEQKTAKYGNYYSAEMTKLTSKVNEYEARLSAVERQTSG